MSDDTPTQRLPASGATPTERILTTGPQDVTVEPRRTSRGLLAGVIIVGVLLLAVVIVLVASLVGGGGTPAAAPTDTPAPTASAQPTESASPTPTATTPVEPPQPTGPAFSSLDPDTEVECARGGPGFTPDPPLIQVSWSTVRTVSVWIVQGTSDAADSGFMQLVNNGDESDFAYPLQFPCFQASTTFTITLVGDDGSHVSESWTITNNGERD